MACTAVSWSGSPVSMTTIWSGHWARIRSSTWMPVRSGRRMSSSTRSAGSFSRIWSPALPQSAVRTWNPSAFSSRGRKWRIVSSSSMTRMVAFNRSPRAPRASAGRGQEKPEGRPLPRCALDLDGTAVALHDPVRHEKAQAGSLRARRVERLEEVRHVLGPDPRSRVRDLDLDARARRLSHGVGPDHHFPTVLDGLQRVLNEVQEHLVELVRVGQDLGPGIGTFETDLDPSFRDGGGQGADDPGGDVGQRDGPQGQHPGAGRREEIGDDGVQAGDLAEDVLDVHPALVPLGEAAAQVLHAGGDAGERIPDLV